MKSLLDVLWATMTDFHKIVYLVGVEACNKLLINPQVWSVLENILLLIF